MNKLSKIFVIVGLVVSMAINANRNGDSNSVKAYAFEKLVFKKCKNPCELKPKIERPFYHRVGS